MIRIFDIFIATLAIVLLSPFLLVISLLLRLTGEGDILYRQTRVGQNGKLFQIYKFATMRRDSALYGTITWNNDERVLPVGRMLRGLKVNEIPQLINVICGEMSLVGPRPQTCEIFSHYNPDAAQIIKSVPPGITGLGSVYFVDENAVLGSDSESGTDRYFSEVMRKKEMLEKIYVRRRTLRFNFIVLFMTVLCVLPGWPRNIVKSTLDDWLKK